LQKPENTNQTISIERLRGT